MHRSISLTPSSNPFGTYKPSVPTTKRRVTKCPFLLSSSSPVDLSADPPTAPAVPAPPPPPARPPSPPTSAGNLNPSLLSSVYGSQPSSQPRNARPNRSRSRSPRSPSPTRRLSRAEKRKRVSKRPELSLPPPQPSVEVPPVSDPSVSSVSPSAIVGTNMTMEKEYFRLTSVGVSFLMFPRFRLRR